MFRQPYDIYSGSMRQTYKGIFRPKNPKKYRGNPLNIIFRSGWEWRVMKHLDENPNVICWQSEEFWIPYRSPLDGRSHRYFPDFWMQALAIDGTIKTMVIEVKPLYQTAPPVRKERRTKRFITESMNYAVNQAKWEAATGYCTARGWEFRIFTEKDLFLNK
jgi:hypothetical protein